MHTHYLAQIKVNVGLKLYEIISMDGTWMVSNMKDYLCLCSDVFHKESMS